MGFDAAGSLGAGFDKCTGFDEIAAVGAACNRTVSDVFDATGLLGAGFSKRTGFDAAEFFLGAGFDRWTGFDAVAFLGPGFDAVASVGAVWDRAAPTQRRIRRAVTQKLFNFLKVIFNRRPHRLIGLKVT
jgi:hypothetical protein